MALELGLIVTDVFNCNYHFLRQLNHLIYHKKWIAVREYLFYLLNIKYGRLVRVVLWYFLLVPVLFYVLLYLLGKLYIAGMARPVCYNMCLEREAYQSQIANNIKQFVPCRLVGEP